MDNHHTVSFSRRVLSYLISALIAGQPVLPAIGAVVTPSGNTKMDKAGNGVPVVNIATPNGAGISHNRYGEYNVGKEGLILNNATGKLNQTQLGGLIQNNPNLKAGQEARGIINEVTGGKRSELKGYTEVAGRAANVMVANPYGITCDGCGFINTPQATLTTGKPVMNADGSLQALEVTKGSITINGAGLDGSQSDAVSIIARAAEINAQLHAKDLSVTTGANRVGADGSITAIKGDGAAPKVAIDTSALGGMYANRIRLASTESGVGVNLGNLNARQGDITLNSAGKLVLKNSLASGNTTITGTDVTLSGDNKAGGSLSATGTTALTLDQSRLVADKNLALSSSGQIVQNGGEVTVGQNTTLIGQSLSQNSSGRINTGNNIALTATGDATLKGSTVAGKGLTVSTGSLNNSGTLAAGTDTTIKTGTFGNTGTVHGNSLKVTTTDLTSSGSLKSNTTLDISARNATLSGDTGAKGRTTVTASGKLDNSGRLISDDTLTLSAAQISNSGTLSGAKELTVTADTLTASASSVAHSDGNLTLNNASTILAGETSAGGAVTVKGSSLKTTSTAQTQGNSVSVDVQNAQLDGTQAARDSLTVKARDSLNHSGKSSASTLKAESGSLSNSGTLTAAVLAINSPTVINNGLIHGERTLSLVSRLLDNRDSGVVYSPAALSLSLPELKNTGIITSDAALSLSGTQLTNSGELSGAALSVDYATLNNNAGGLLLAQGGSVITAQALSNAGTIAGNTLTLNADRLTGSGLLQGDTALSLTAGILDLLAGSSTFTGGDLTLSGTKLTTAGQTQGQDVSVNARDWHHSGSSLATGSLDVSATGTFSNTGDLMSQGDTTLKAGTTDNRGSLLSAGDLSLSGNSLDNSGTVQGNRVTVHQDRITNSGTLTGIAALTLGARPEMAAPLLTLTNNSGGSLLTTGDLTLSAGSISNAGQWQGKRVLIHAQTVTNSGALQAAELLDAQISNSLTGTSGSKITSNGELALSALTLSNSGQWIAKNLTLKAVRLTNSGDITGVDALSVTLNQPLNNQAGGKLLSAGNLTLSAGSVTNAGQIQGKTTAITAGSLVNSGRLQGESLALNVSGGLSNTANGVLLSQNAMNVTAATLNNQGAIQGGGESSVKATTRVQNDGKILSGSKLTLTAPALANNSTGLVQAVTLLLDVVSAINNGRVMATGSAELKGTTLNNSGTLQGADLLVNYRTLSNSGTALGTTGLTVKGDSLVQTDAGHLYSAGNLLLDMRDVSGRGQVVALGDATLKLVNALTHTGTLAAGKTLSVTSQNVVTNNGVIQGNAIVLSAGGTFTNNKTLTTGSGNSTFSAQSLLLSASGSLQAGGDVSLTSRGNITVNGFTGTAGSLTMTVAGTLLNTALIYAGNNLKLFADRIHNIYGDILAGNSLWMQKTASGTANTEIINRSGNIETLRGDITMKTGHLLNQRDGFSATTTTVSNPSAINGMGGATIEVPLSLMPDGSYGYFTREVENQHGTPCNGHGACNITIDTVYYYAPFAEHATQRFLSSQRVTTVNGGDNPAGRITSGKNLTVQAGLLENQASFILANGDIALSGNQLSNQSWQTGTENVYLVYRYDPRSTYWSGGYATGSLDELGPRLPEFKNDTLIFTLDGQATDYTQGETYYSVIRAGGNVGINFTSSVNNGTTSAHAGSVSNTITAPALNTLSQQNISGGLTQTTLQDAGAVAVGSPQWRDEVSGALQDISGGTSLSGQSGSSGSYPLPSGNNGYFVPSTDPDSPYLITVNPKLDGLGNLDSSLFNGLYGLLGMKPGQAPQADARWSDEKQFLGSSYFLDRLGLKPEKDYRFLGDAAFDTRYVSNAMLNQTGSRYINGLGSDLEQMQYLMDSAASQQKGLGLQFGVALTAEQVARLTGSILWWESATINGQTVMVPKLYLSPRDITINNGSVISGNNVQIAAGNIINSSGTLTAQNSLTLDSASSIDNLNAGLINAGGNLNLSAIGDINNIGSAIAGKTVALESISGSINNVTRTQQWSAGSDGRYGSVHVSGTDTGPVATITATDALSLDAGRNINITGANVTSGGTLGMSAGNDISITANQISESKSQSGFWRTKDNSSSSTTSQGSTVSAGGNLVMVADNNLNVTASNISAQDSALLSAGNDLNLNAARESNNTRNGKSESHESHAAVSTVTAGNNLTLAAGRDITSQAAGIAAENDVAIQAGRDVNLMAEAANAGNSYISKNKKEINESVRQQGTEILSGGDTTITAGRDITSEASSVTAVGDIALNAGRDVTLTTATESDYHYKETKKKSGGFLSKKTTHTITEDSNTREAGSLLSGNSVTVNAGHNLTVKGSDVVADHDVTLGAGNNVDILAATNTDTAWRFKETKKSGLMGTGGIGITIGSSRTTHDRREAGTTQSQSASTIGSTTGNVSITAGNQAHISGSDVIANRDISITGNSVIIDPGHDKRTVNEKFEQKSTGVTVALSGAVGNALNSAVTSAQEAKENSDSRLGALKGTQAILSGVQAGANYGLQQQSADPNNGIGVSISLNHQQSKSETKYQHDMVSGSTLSAGNNISITATGKNKGQNNSGDILIAGSQIKSGNDTTLNAQNDILLAAAANTQQTTGKNSSKGGGVGVSFGGGSNGGGLSIFASVNGSKGSEKGNGTTWTETTVDAGNHLTLTSGRDTTLSGAQVSGEKVTADVGHNLTISSLQDSDRYDSKQNSVAAGGSFTFGPGGGGSGYISVSQDKIKSNYDSVQEQSGIYAGKGGFDVTVGNHTQLDGAVIASTATDDKNRLDTGTLGWTDIHNEADYKTSHTGISVSGGSGMSGSQMVASNAMANAANALTGLSGSKGHAEGTTSSAISGGSIIIRDRDNQKQDTADLSRDPENANGSIAPIFDKEKEQQRLKEAQVISQISGQMSNIVMTLGETEAMKEARKNPDNAGKTDAQLRDTPEYKGVMKGYGTGSTPQMVVQAITGVLGGLNADNFGQALAGGLNPVVAQLIKNGTEGNDKANLMAHAVWGALAAQLGGNNAAAGAAGAFSGELAARYIIDNYYGGKTDNLSEQERQQISMLATIASGIAGGLAGNSTAAAGTGAQAGKNAADNNSLKVIAEGCVIAAPCRSKVAEQLLEIGVKAGLTGAVAKTLADKLTADELDHLVTLQMTGNDEITGKYLGLLQDKYAPDASSNPNLGKDLDNDQKAELGGTGSGTGTPPPPENDPKQQNEKPVEKLNQKQESAIKKIDNTIKNALKDHDITGTLKDMDGNPVPKENGGYWDHMQEMQNTLRGLRNHADTLKNVNNPEAQAAYGRATDAINKIESALKGHGI
ncbi:putative heme utilization/adhesion exoprotein [Trabulsiella guamensis ATCC 49490]|uniref:Putative heme utilization/adhesion exoprotein n=1 Tax=Trabulsiella guamensis ATCC 49490 TaxID=1005994 RepID=A0A085AAB6_9ENTR|nr:hemagglutinin repeat-containing protein [Trabulsiella guamensis]KFC07161.1 putative heme utilization/adhesion exoprotein [Trabulsiella guamensis ATCC 49490]